MEFESFGPGPFRQGVLAVMTETFEGAQQEWSWYLDGRGNAGLLATLAGVSAQQASRPTPLGASIGAQARHILFHLSASLSALRGESANIDWDSAWQETPLDEAAWRELRGTLHDAYHELRGVLQARDAWDTDEAGGVVATVTHAAYHLGVVRQLLKFL